jgi:hypothetical protein
MDSSLFTESQQGLVHRAIAQGRLRDEAQAVVEELLLWEERERRRIAILAEVEEAELSVAAGRSRPITEESMWDLVGLVKKWGRVKLEAEGNSP